MNRKNFYCRQLFFMIALLLGSVEITSAQTFERTYPVPTTGLLEQEYMGSYSYEPGTGMAICNAGGDGNDSTYILSVDSTGNVKWLNAQLSYSNTWNRYSHQSVMQLPGGSVISGSYAWNGSMIHYILTKYNNSGQVTDSVDVPLNAAVDTIATNEIVEDVMYSSLRRSGDKAYLALNYVYYNNANNYSNGGSKIYSVIYQIDSNVGIIWKDTLLQNDLGNVVPDIEYYNSYPQYYASTLGVTKDGGFAIYQPVPLSDSIPAGTELHLLKGNSDGSVQWTTILNPHVSNTAYPESGPPIATSDSGMVLNLNTYDGGPDGGVNCFLHFTKDGQLQDSLKLSGANFSAYLDYGMRSTNGNLLYLVADNLGQTGIVHFDEHLTFLNYQPMGVNHWWQGTLLLPNSVGGGVLGYVDEYAVNISANIINLISFDSLGNTYPCTASGRLDYDANSNCATDAGEEGFPGRPVMATNAGGQNYYSFADYLGNYRLSLPQGSYTLATTTDANKVIFCPSIGYQQVTFTAPGIDSSLSFYEHLIPSLTDVSVSSYTDPFVAGFEGTVNYMVSNNGSVPFTGSLQVMVDPLLTLDSSMPVATSIAGNSYSYVISALQPDDAVYITMSIRPQVAALDSAIQIVATLPLAGDATPANNTDTIGSVVVGSFDPNCKSVNRPLYANKNSELVYKIHFQNTGTSAARNVVVTDVLDPMLNPATFRLLGASSAPPAISWQEGGRMVFAFNNINLPDSSASLAGSNGWLAYAIKANSSAPLGDTIRNNAAIYFDFNAPVLTDTTMNILGQLQSADIAQPQASRFQLYPNPSTGTVTIVPPYTGKWLVTATDVAGRSVPAEQSASAGQAISIRLGAASGIYLLRITNAATGTSITQKLTLQQ